jgi:hypothetical protein
MFYHHNVSNPNQSDGDASLFSGGEEYTPSTNYNGNTRAAGYGTAAYHQQ